ncbi:tripartite tricarboxylate transporter TctB family protein [Afifella sp. IM 167]|uniref:tripartite tricarboxylate transporter TctB family protein n=1 Tax=Afifella sp. IM 167 TaxID=2033586 RepID=UPI001CCB2FAD|nr:tripartite tricarboxylate transporter TctB family protein [Afifella sp. IM 167]
MKRDTWVAVAVMAIAAFAAWDVYDLKRGAAFFPLLMSAALFLGGAVLFVASLRRPAPAADAAPEGSDTEEAKSIWVPLLEVVVLTAVFAVAMPWIGFYPATFLYLAVFFALRSELSRLTGLAVAVAMTVLIFVIFSLLLAVPTPVGPLAAYL